MINKNKGSAFLTMIAEWLDERELPAFIPRTQSIPQPENLKRILAVVGPRRAGKTYFMYQIIHSLLQRGICTRQDILFVDFEDYRWGEFTGSDIDELFAAFHQLTGHLPRFLFFDEVHQLPDWQRVLRTLHNRGCFRIVVSGSNSRLLGGEIAAELRGRYQDTIMLPFSFREYLRYREITFTPATLRTSAQGRIVAAFDDYIRHGGFPEVGMAQDDAERRKLLQSYYRTIFYRDILERYNIKARHVLDSLMNDVLENYSSTFSISRFEKQLKTQGLAGSKRTISNYLHYLEEAFFIIANQKFAYSPRRRIMNPKKLYLIDTGFVALGHPFSENRGRILENVVAIELMRQEAESYYHKMRRECDFIIKQGTRPASAVQVCWELSRQNQNREIAGLKEACSQWGLQTGLILTYSQEERRQENGLEISVIPVWRWLLADDSQT